MIVIPTLTILLNIPKFVDRLKTDEIFKGKFGIFFREVRLDSKLSLLYHPLFIFRRLLFCVSMFYMADTPSL